MPTFMTRIQTMGQMGMLRLGLSGLLPGGGGFPGMPGGRRPFG